MSSFYHGVLWVLVVFIGFVGLIGFIGFVGFRVAVSDWKLDLAFVLALVVLFWRRFVRWQ